MTKPAPLVPPADRPFAPPPADDRETMQETVWYNPTDQDVILDLYVGTSPVYSPALRAQFANKPAKEKWELRTGLRRYVIPSKAERAIPREFDRGIQQYECQDGSCLSNKLYCTDHTHRHLIVGGLGPQLVNKGLQERPKLHPALDTTEAKNNEAIEKAAMATVVATKAAQDLAKANELLEQARLEKAQAEEELAQMKARGAEDAARSAGNEARRQPASPATANAPRSRNQE